MFKESVDILHMNGIYGYQYSIGNCGPTFIFCFCEDPPCLRPMSDEAVKFWEWKEGHREEVERRADEHLAELRRRSGSRTLLRDSWLCRGYLTVAWFEYDLIPAIFDAMLALGHWFRTNNHAQVYFGPPGPCDPPGTAADVRFSPEEMERKYLAGLRKLIEIEPLFESSNRTFLGYRQEAPWNYITAEGRDFCAHLRKARGLSAAPDPKDNYFLWDSFKPLDCEEFQAAARRARELYAGGAAAKSTTEEDDFCLVCMVGRPETRVLPCGHSVVCRRCSVSLRATGDAHVCVRCRRPITGIVDLVTAE